jgi:hypothetical protein
MQLAILQNADCHVLEIGYDKSPTDLLYNSTPLHNISSVYKACDMLWKHVYVLVVILIAILNYENP